MENRLKIGFFAFHKGAGCRSMAIHLANYLACDNNTVALVEVPTIDKNSEFKFSVPAEEDGTNVFNGVRFYPATCEAEPTEQWIVANIGEINTIYHFKDTYDKLYLCTTGSDEDFNLLQIYIGENPGFHTDILLFGASKDTLRKWSNAGFKTVLVSAEKEPRISQQFAMMFNTYLLMNRIKPPVYKSNRVYEPVPFADATDFVADDAANDDSAESEPANGDSASNEASDEPAELTSGLSVHSKVRGSDATGIDYVDVPVPEFDETAAEKKTKEERKAEKEAIAKAKQDEIAEKKRVAAEKRSVELSKKKEEAAKKKAEAEAKRAEIAEKRRQEAAVRAEERESKKLRRQAEREERQAKREAAAAEKEPIDINGKIKEITSLFGKKKSECDDVVREKAFCVGDWYDGASFKYSMETPCKDLSQYSVFQNGSTVCIGLRKNAKKNSYDNTDDSLIVLDDNIPGEFIQFMTQDLLSGEYELERFTKEDVLGMTAYFKFECQLFSENIGNSVSLSEFLSFKAYYNELVGIKMLLDQEWRDRERRAHDLYSRYNEYAELYSMPASLTERELYDGVVKPFRDELERIKKEHLKTDNAIALMDTLISDFWDYDHEYNGVELPKETHRTTADDLKKASEDALESDNDDGLGNVESMKEAPTAMQAQPINTTPMQSMFYQPGYMQPAMMAGAMPVMAPNGMVYSMQQGVPGIPTRSQQIGYDVDTVANNVRFAIICYDKNHEQTDRAVFGGINYARCVKSFLNRKSYIKKLCVVTDSDVTPMFSGKDGGLITTVPLPDDKIQYASWQQLLQDEMAKATEG